jgi:hypothetical protein
MFNYQAVYLFKKGNYYFLFIITVSASNLYMSMIWLYVFLLDFLIPFLCDPDLQCSLSLLFQTMEDSVSRGDLERSTKDNQIRQNHLILTNPMNEDDNNTIFIY